MMSQLFSWDAQLLCLLRQLEQGRKARKLSRHALAEMLGVNEKTLRRIENGEADPAQVPIGLLCRWADAIGGRCDLSFTLSQAIGDL